MAWVYTGPVEYRCAGKVLALRYGTGSHEAVGRKSGLPGTREEGKVRT